jgi:hypothetical protein
MASMLLCVSYEELGLGKATIDELRRELAGFAASQCLHLFSVFNAVLSHPSNILNFQAHDALVKWLFPESVAAKILQSGRAALHRQQLLYTMKAAVLNCGGKERDWTKADFEKIGVLCLMGSDLLPMIPEEKSTGDLQRFVRFVLHFAPVDEAAPHYSEHNITRAYLMLTDSLERLRNSKMFVDVRQVFENAARG